MTTKFSSEAAANKFARVQPGFLEVSVERVARGVWVVTTTARANIFAK